MCCSPAGKTPVCLQFINAERALSRNSLKIEKLKVLAHLVRVKVRMLLHRAAVGIEIAALASQTRSVACVVLEDQLLDAIKPVTAATRAGSVVRDETEPRKSTTIACFHNTKLSAINLPIAVAESVSI